MGIGKRELGIDGGRSSIPHPQSPIPFLHILTFLCLGIEFRKGSPSVHLEYGGFFGDVAAGERTDLSVDGSAERVPESCCGCAEQIVRVAWDGLQEMRKQSGEVLFERCNPIEHHEAMGGGERFLLDAWVK